jgi:predicted P-loop ATPase/GTPase
MGVKDEKLKSGLYADCSDDDIEYVKSKSKLQIVKPFMEPIRVTGIINTVKKYYIKCLEDRSIPPDVQEGMYSGHINDVIEINSSHSPFLSRPDELFVILTNIAKST